MKDVVFVGHGDLMLDNIYDGNLNLIKQDGGGCNWNTLYSLASWGEKCYAIGTRGDDEEGKLTIDSLKRVNINTDYVEIEDKRTNVMNIILPKEKLEDNNVVHSWYCPITGRRTVNFSSKLPIHLPKELENKTSFILLDRVRKVNLDFIKNVKNKKVCLDVAHIRFIRYFKGEYLLNFLRQANIILVNDHTAKMLFDKLKIKTPEELFKLLNLDLLVFTAGSKNATFIFNENKKVKVLDLKPEIIDDCKDNTGAGDAFWAVVLKQYAYTDKIDTPFVEKTFKLANQASIEIVQQLGSRK